MFSRLHIFIIVSILTLFSINLRGQNPEVNVDIEELKANIEQARIKGNFNTLVNHLQTLEESGYLHKKPKELSNLMIEIASCNWSMHQYDESMKYCNKVMPLLIKQNYTEGKIETLILMYHNAHFSTADTTWPNYLDDALTLATELQDSVLLSEVLYNIGYSQYRENNHLKAIEYYKKARDYNAQKGNGLDFNTVIMQQLSYTLIDSISAVGITSEYVINKSKQTGNTGHLGNAYRGRAWFFAKTDQKDSARIYLLMAHEHRQSFTEKSKASPGFYRYLHDVAMLIPDYELALKFINISLQQVRRISKETNAEELSQNRAELDYKLQRQRIEKLTLESKLEKEKGRKQQVLIIAFFVVIILVLGFLVFARNKYVQLQLSSKELVRKNKELDKLNLQLSSAEHKLHSNNNGIVVKDEEQLYFRLKLLFDKEKVYKKQELTIRKLATQLNTNTSYLSAVINNRFEISFKTLLNQYRINEARQMLDSPEYSKLTIEAIATEVGYHSRSTFYNAFKEVTGLTPTQYLKSTPGTKS